MIKIVIIGSGNVAQHLIKAFEKSSDINLVQVFSRNLKVISNLINSDKITNDFSNLVEADLYIVGVSDDSIASVSSQLPFKNRLVVHTAGSISMDALDIKNRNGIFYPLQTFSKNVEVDFSIIPICLETQNEVDYILLEKVALSLSKNVYQINSNQRKSLHISAVFVNNFVNHLYQIGSEICTKNQLPFDLLKPLILETASKIKFLSPQDAQTGPASRNDSKTITSHLDFLQDENHKNIYKILTQSLQYHGKKL